MLPSATDRKNVKNRVAVLVFGFWFFSFLECPKYKKKLTVFEGKFKNTNK